MSEAVIVVGGGGHAAVVIEVLRLSGLEVLGVCDPALRGADATVCGVPVLGGDDEILARPAGEVRLVNAVGSTRSTAARAAVFERFQDHGYEFATILHPGAILSGTAELGEGAQLMAGAVVQARSSLGPNVLINTGASVDHDCRVATHVHVAPGATLSGGVVVERGVHIGTGATVVQSVTIGRDSLIAAGAVVTEDVPAGSVVRPPRASVTAAAS